MRVTTSMVANNVGTNLNNLRRRLARVETELGTGKSIQKMSDGPSNAAEVLRVNTAMKTLDHWESNMADLNGWLLSTESALEHMMTGMQRLRDLTVQGANGTNPQDALNNLAREVDTILDGLVATANQKHAGYSLFAGHRVTSKPFAFDTATGVTVYSGDDGITNREIGPGVVVAANLTGNELMEAGDMFKVAWDISEALKTGDTDTVGNKLDELDTVLQSVITQRAIVGARVNRLENARVHAIDSRVTFSQLLEQAQGVEMERAILELNQVDAAYRTALQVGARIIPPTLVDFMR